MEERKMTDMLSRYLSGENLSRNNDSDLEAQEAFDKFVKRKRRAETTRHRCHIWITTAAVAACAAVLAVFVIPASVKSPDSGKVFEAVSSAGQVQEVTLPDGSHVWLNAASRLVCSSGFGTNDRNVTLEGEAYFDAVRDSLLPLVVSTGRARVMVLGTAFSLRDYPDDESASVSLYRGSVSFGTGGSSIILEPGQSAIIRGNAPELLDRQIPASWRDGVLFFDDCPLERVCSDISRAYGVPVTISDSQLKELRFSARLSTRNHTLEETLDILSLTNKLRFRKSGKGYEVF